MKIAVPMVGDMFSEHFGGAEAFGLYEADEEARTITSCVVAQAPPHERGAFPRWLREQGAGVIVAGGMGPRAVMMFEQFGIRVVSGASGPDPEAVVRAYLAGTLPAGGPTCAGGHLHACGDHGEEGE